MLQKTKKGRPDEEEKEDVGNFGKNLKSLFQKPVINSSDLDAALKEEEAAERKRKEKEERDREAKRQRERERAAIRSCGC